MEQETMWGALGVTLGGSLPTVFGALAILAIGWFVAVTLRAALRRLLMMSGLNRRLKDAVGQEMDAEGALTLGVFWLVLLVTLIAVLNALNLENVSAPFAALLERITSYVPQLIAGRSEEHTSELQSRENLVCRLLLEKKKNQSNSVST